MSLVKRTVTPRMLAANRANAKKSTGPRTAAGKARSSLNGLRSGRYSKVHDSVGWALLESPVGCDVRELASRLLPPAYANHPLFREMIEFFHRAIHGASGLGRGRPRKNFVRDRSQYPPLESTELS